MSGFDLASNNYANVYSKMLTNIWQRFYQKLMHSQSDLA